MSIIDLPVDDDDDDGTITKKKISVDYKKKNEFYVTNNTEST